MLAGLDKTTLAIFILIFILALGVLALLLFDIKAVPKAPVQTLGYLSPVHLATTGPLTLTDENPPALVDQTIVQPGDRILVMHQDDASENGIWEFVSEKGWQRCQDLRKERQAIVGSLIYVTSGTTNGDKTFVLQVSSQRAQRFRTPPPEDTLVVLPSKHPEAFSIYLHILPVSDMVLGTLSGPPPSEGSTLMIGPTGRPEWSSHVDMMHFSRVLQTESWTVSDDVMSMYLLKVSDEWIAEDTSLFLLVIQVEGTDGSTQVMRYEILTSSNRDQPRTVVLKKDRFAEKKSENKPVTLVNVDGSTTWWSKQEYRGVMAIGGVSGKYLARWFKLT